MKRRAAAPGLRARLAEAEATLEAIRTGEVDALVVSGPQGERTLAIEGATHPYHTLLDAMGDGAALLTEEGTILFANRRLLEMAHLPNSGSKTIDFQRLVAPGSRPAFEAILHRPAGVGEFLLDGGPAPGVPVWISFSTLPLDAEATPGRAAARMIIVRDLTERKGAEAGRLDLMKRLISAEDDERRRIARELHDETGQSLTALLVGLRVIQEQTTLAAAQAEAERLRKVAGQTMDNVGRLARGLHPAVLDDLGLLAAARRYVSDYAKAHDLKVDLRSEGVGVRRLPSLVQNTIYRILQEGLTNVVRHARARSVEVALILDADRLTLEIGDDGIGFDPEVRHTDAPGLGLHGMGERAALLGGTLTIRSAPGQGTRLRASVPVEPDAGGPT